MRDIKGVRIEVGDILLNVQEWYSPFDSWAYLICVPDRRNPEELVIRDFNAWNMGYLPEETMRIAHYTNPICSKILKDENETVEKLKEAIEK